MLMRPYLMRECNMRRPIGHGGPLDRKAGVVNLDQLKQFEAIARMGTMIAAAKELHLTQPALSRAMRRLEDELGANLFERRGRSLMLSREGEAALEYVRAIIHEERLMRIALNELAESASTLLVATVAPTPLWRLTALIVERFPEQLLSSRIESQQDVERSIMNGDADLGISHKPVTYPSIECCHLMDERISIAVPEGHPLAKNRSLAPADLEGETFLMYENVGFWAEGVRRALPRSKFIIQEDPAVLEQLAATGAALSFVSDAPHQHRTISGHVLLPFDDPSASASFYLLARTDAPALIREVFMGIEEASAA